MPASIPMSSTENGERNFSIDQRVSRACKWHTVSAVLLSLYIESSLSIAESLHSDSRMTNETLEMQIYSPNFGLCVLNYFDDRERREDPLHPDKTFC